VSRAPGVGSPANTQSVPITAPMRRADRLVIRHPIPPSATRLPDGRPGEKPGGSARLHPPYSTAAPSDTVITVAMATLPRLILRSPQQPEPSMGKHRFRSTDLDRNPVRSTPTSPPASHTPSGRAAPNADRDPRLRKSQARRPLRHRFQRISSVQRLPGSTIALHHSRPTPGCSHRSTIRLIKL
jgi:hypothetical protein